MKKAHERGRHGHTGNTRHFPRNGFTAYFALSPGGQALLSPSPALLLADLTPASGRQNDTTSPYASARSSHALPASTASRPALVTTRDRPSGGTRRLGYASDLGQAKTEIFLISGLDTISENQK